MAKREILAGSTDQTIDVFINDSSSTTGAGLTGLAYNTSSLVCYYRKGATGTPTALTLATQTVGGAHSDGGFVAVDGTNCPGQYRLDLSDTIVATAGMVTIYLGGAANMVPCVTEIEVVSVNKFDSVRMGLTALPNAAADGAGGLPISDAGGLDLDARLDAAVSSRSTLTQSQVTGGAYALNSSSFAFNSALTAVNANVQQIRNSTQSADDLKDFADTGYDPATHKVAGVVLVDTLTTYTSNTPQTGDVYALANGVAGFVALKADTAATLADTNELQTDWANGGRLDLILDARASQASVDTIDGILDTHVALWTSTIAGRIDAAISTRLASASYTAPDNATITAIAGYIDTEITAIYNRLGAPAGASIAADIAAIDAGSAPTASQVADAVWDELLSGHATSGSAGALLSAAGVASDPWAAASRTLTSTGTVTVVGPVAVGGAAEIVQGDTHTAAAAGVLDWSSTDWPDLTTATVALRLSKRGKATYVWGKAGTVVNGGAATQTARFELTSAETAALDSGVYDLQITGTISGAIVTLVLTTLTVRARVPA